MFLSFKQFRIVISFLPHGQPCGKSSSKLWNLGDPCGGDSAIKNKNFLVLSLHCIEDPLSNPSSMASGKSPPPSAFRVSKNFIASFGSEKSLN